MKPLEGLHTSLKFKRKPIPPPLPIIPNNIESPVLPTPNSAIGTPNQTLPLTSPPVSKQPTVLKSILKQSSHSSSTSTETRKAVHIISANSPIESTTKYTLPFK